MINNLDRSKRPEANRDTGQCIHSPPVRIRRLAPSQNTRGKRGNLANANSTSASNATPWPHAAHYADTTGSHAPANQWPAASHSPARGAPLIPAPATFSPSAPATPDAAAATRFHAAIVYASIPASNAD